MAPLTLPLSPEITEKDKLLYEKYLNTFVKKYNRHIAYGTAGFRDHADFLEHVSLRVGIFQGIVAKLEIRKVLGVIITASHNPLEDNGIKQTDFDGTMIRAEFEELVNPFMVDPDIN